MKQETKQCQNCKKDFIIDEQDFAFYSRISVPEPRFCPDCRFLSRAIWRNEWVLNKRKDSRTGDQIFSVYSDNAPVNVYHKDYWWSDDWDAQDYAQEYNFNKSFFSQIGDLLHKVPLPSAPIIEGINSDYCMNFSRLKDCYLVFASVDCENCAYIIFGVNSKDSFNSNMLYSSELCSGDLNVKKSFETHLSVNCEDCHNIILCKNCNNCSDCIGCMNLRNNSYYILNKQYAKEEYFSKLKELNLNSFSSLEKLKKQIYDFWLTQPIRFMSGRHNNNISGEYINNSKNAHYCYRAEQAEDVKYCQNIYTPTTKDCYDYTNWGDNSELIYYSLQCGEHAYNIKFCISCFPGISNLEYSIFCANSSNLFGCVGLKNKQYCILNKQYTKEQYEELIPRIKKHMNDMSYIDSKGRKYEYGDFFPFELSPFAYNETICQEFFPLTKEQSIEKSYQWKDMKEKDIKPTIKAEDLSDDIKDVKDDITKEIIGCIHNGKCNDQCTIAFKIIPKELDFYRKMNLPLPRLCPNCRFCETIKHRSSIKLYNRKCDNCKKDILTPHFSNKEIIYCEECYKREVN